MALYSEYIADKYRLFKVYLKEGWNAPFQLKGTGHPYWGSFDLRDDMCLIASMYLGRKHSFKMLLRSHGTSNRFQSIWLQHGLGP